MNFSSNPQVSVIIPVYNGEEDLEESIDCLRSQTYPSDRVEYWIVDNNSSDRSAEIIKAAIADPSNKITLHYLSENRIQSSYAARNAGIRAARGEIIAFTDADCRPESHWLSTLIQPFWKKNIGIVAGEIKALPGKSLLEKYADREETLSQKHTLSHPFCAYGQTANLAIRRSIFEEIGLFRPYLTTGGDADICWRILRKTDWEIEFSAEAIVKHRHRSTLKGLRNQWRRYGESNRYLHELYGVELMRESDRREYLYRLTRWLLKEIPIATGKAIARRSSAIDFLKTPIGLFCLSARVSGQRESQLLEKAQKIEWLDRPFE
ncbi:glycosyltransferase [Oxynema aestuarii]|uniref:Glycosyltransferase n=1 Tax=Oxynema aestuarii AP17 TaxID=2064643 RepID=A0A6H1TUL8_9CYAN|nr:glycosyltransferase [Oxynema aestuarii]QIZ70304.1 glycosyltransferase [Oxynema aestuarii AP17]